MTTKVQTTITVDVPISTAYGQWTQFEELPQFMGGVQRVEQLDDKRLHRTRWPIPGTTTGPRPVGRCPQASRSSVRTAARRLLLGRGAPRPAGATAAPTPGTAGRPGR